jgi:hypothetical protein
MGTTDPDGSLVLEPPPARDEPGNHLVVSGSSDSAVADPVLPGRDATANEIPLDFRLGSIVVGRIVGPDGSPASGRARATGVEFPHHFRASSDDTNEGVASDEAGQFRLVVDGEGTCWIDLFAPGRGRTDRTVSLRRGETSDLGDVVLDRTVRLEGRVLLATEERLPTVVATRYERLPRYERSPTEWRLRYRHEATTDPDGCFRLSDLDPGLYRVQVMLWGGAVCRAPALDAATDRIVRVPLETPLELDARRQQMTVDAVNDAGEPAEVSLRTSAGDDVVEWTCGPSHPFRLDMRPDTPLSVLTGSPDAPTVPTSVAPDLAPGPSSSSRVLLRVSPTPARDAGGAADAARVWTTLHVEGPDGQSVRARIRVVGAANGEDAVVAETTGRGVRERRRKVVPSGGRVRIGVVPAREAADVRLELGGDEWTVESVPLVPAASAATDVSRTVVLTAR